jgi:hypothetical protein
VSNAEPSLPRVPRRAKLHAALLGLGAGAGKAEPSASRIPRRAKLHAALLGLRPGARFWPVAEAGPQSQPLLFKKGAASALAFRPSYWSYYANTPGGGLAAIPLAGA